MTSARDMAEKILGKSVNDFISRKLRTGSSWSDIGSDLFIATGGNVDVSVASLKSWHSKPRVPLDVANNGV